MKEAAPAIDVCAIGDAPPGDFVGSCMLAKEWLRGAAAAETAASIKKSVDPNGPTVLEQIFGPSVGDFSKP
jgi:hypothetical protein